MSFEKNLNTVKINHAKIIAEKILEISKMGIPILLVEQNANLALELSNRAYVIETGNIEISGQSSELAKNSDIQRAYLGVGD